MREILRSEWEPGQHFSVVAPTGYGKSLLTVRGLLPRFTHTVTLDVKGDDPELRRAGQKVPRFPTRLDLLKAELSDRNPEFRFRVHPGGLGTAARAAFDDVFRKAWAAGSKRRTAGSWLINIDETRIMADHLGMQKHLTTGWVLGRSKGITILAGTQAPRFVPSEFYDQVTWLAIGRFRDERTLKRLSEIGGTVGDNADLRDILPHLQRSRSRREFLILGPDDFAAITSWSPDGR
jgi:hypothetical protein